MLDALCCDVEERFWQVFDKTEQAANHAVLLVTSALHVCDNILTTFFGLNASTPVEFFFSDGRQMDDPSVSGVAALDTLAEPVGRREIELLW